MIIVVAVAGGAVGVIVKVLIWPVTVVTEVKGVADQELLDVVELGVGEVVSVVGVEEVVGVRLSDTGIG